MAFRSSIIIAALLGFYFFGFNNIKPEPVEREAVVLKGMIQTIKYAHMAPKEIDDNLSKEVYKTFLKRLDGGKRYFTQKDIDDLQKYEYLVDEEINNLTFNFFNDATAYVEKGIEKAKQYFTEAIDKKIDFNRTGFYETDPDKMIYATDDNSLKEKWSQIVQYEVLNKWQSSIKSQEENKSVDADLKTDEELKEEAIKDIRKRYLDFFDRIQKLRRSDRMDAYLSSISNYFDPHTDYFSPIEKQNFDIGMGGKLEGIGARLQSDGDYTKIFSLVVGGPAWKTKELEDGDMIMKIRQAGEEESVDIAGMRLDDVVQLIRGKKGTTVILTVQKKDKSIADVPIERDEVQLEEGKVKSVIVSMPGKVQNIGYINLPKFYSSFEVDGGNSCAVDVAEEIEKLKDQDVNGIILDLRNNSGGSLADVVDMSGFFIEDGPIVQVKGRQDKPALQIDKDPGVLYTGPLIIMVNEYSASASEIIAAAMQDYDRAIIVGSPSTFGKGTVQRFFDLDRVIGGNSAFKPLGNVKITTQKFYRINGGSTQLKGVESDIVLPDVYQYLDSGEKDYEYAMPWTEINPTKYSQSVVLLENKQKVINLSKERIANNTDFRLINERALLIKKEKDNSLIPIGLNDFKNYVSQRENENKKYKDIMKDDVENLEITNLSMDKDKINADESAKAKNEEFIKGLKKDIYLEETLYIIRDMINLEKSFAAIQPKIIE